MAKKKRKRIASRGSVNDIILKTLVNGDKYGYEIIKEVEEYSDGKIILKQPSLYSSLSRFEEKGLVSSYWGDSDIGGRRHYYHLTDRGKTYFNEKNKPKSVDIKPATNTENINSTFFKPQPTNVNNTQAQAQTIVMEEVDIPAIVDFEEKNISETFVPDHNFVSETPIEKKLEILENLAIENTNKECISNQPLVDDSSIWKDLSNQVKINNKKFANSPYRKLHYIKPKKSQKVILDTDGIYKLRDIDYVPQKTKSQEKIIDNVGKRIENKNFGYATYSQNTSKPKVQSKELTDEERKIRNENFLAKFNSLTKSRLKPVEQKPIVEEKPQEEIDYRSKLDIFSRNEDEKQNVIKNTPEPETNNLFNYIEEETQQKNTFENEENIEEDEDDKFINFEPVDFETKKDNKKYIEEINNYETQEKNDIKMTRYESKSNAILVDKSYVLINKVKCVFGFILLLLFAFEISLSLIIFKNLDLIKADDKKLFIIAYIFAFVISLCFMLPALFNPSEHKINNFRLKYSMILGILTFLVSIILVYCINALLGFQLDNFEFFAVKLILPLVLTLNFVITPPIFAGILKSKKFYD